MVWLAACVPLCRGAAAVSRFIDSGAQRTLGRKEGIIKAWRGGRIWHTLPRIPWCTQFVPTTTPLLSPSLLSPAFHFLSSCCWRTRALPKNSFLSMLRVQDVFLSFFFSFSSLPLPCYFISRGLPSPLVVYFYCGSEEKNLCLCRNPLQSLALLGFFLPLLPLAFRELLRAPSYNNFTTLLVPPGPAAAPRYVYHERRLSVPFSTFPFFFTMAKHR